MNSTQWKLVRKNGLIVNNGDIVYMNRQEYRVIAQEPPRHAGSTGKVIVQAIGHEFPRTLFAHALDCSFVQSNMSSDAE